MGQWLIPWTERGASGAVIDNFLWRHDRLYVMDNHRLALWCWWQHLAESRWWHFTHIDRHYDALWQTSNPWRQHARPDHKDSLDAYREASFPSHSDAGLPLALYRWDTIVSALWSLHRAALRDITFATADEGDFPAIERAEHIKPWALPSVLAYQAASDDDEHWRFPRIVDVDLDYFTRHDLGGEYGPVFSDEYVAHLGQSLRAGLETGRFGVVTVALSPETTGSWALAERALGRLLSGFPEFVNLARGIPLK